MGEERNEKRKWITTERRGKTNLEKRLQQEDFKELTKMKEFCVFFEIDGQLGCSGH